MASLGMGASKFSLPRTLEEMVYFSSLPKSKDFPFSVCEMQEGNLGKGCGQASAHTPDIPLPHNLPLRLGGSRSRKMVSVPC